MMNKELFRSERINLSLSPSLLANIVLCVNLLDLRFQGLDAPLAVGAGAPVCMDVEGSLVFSGCISTRQQS